jgi:gas vesicle protein
MKESGFVMGMALGVMAGAALGTTMAPKKKCAVKKAAGKAMKTVGQAMEDLSADLGLH